MLGTPCPSSPSQQGKGPYYFSAISGILASLPPGWGTSTPTPTLLPLPGTIRQARAQEGPSSRSPQTPSEVLKRDLKFPGEEWGEKT